MEDINELVEETFVLPPPDLRNIIDRTARFVAKTPALEDRIKEKESADPKFGFIREGNVYRAYYKRKLQEFILENQEGVNNEPKVKQDNINSTDSHDHSDNEDMEMDSNEYRQNIALDTNYFLNFTSGTTQYDVEIMNLTAKYATMYGKKFLQSLSTKDDLKNNQNPELGTIQPVYKNNDFSFIGSRNHLNPIFTKLLDQYKSIKHFNDKELESMKNRTNKGKLSYIQTAKDHAKVEKRSDESKGSALYAARRRRELFGSMDWHDFVILNTIDLDSQETNNENDNKNEKVSPFTLEEAKNGFINTLL